MDLYWNSLIVLAVLTVVTNAQGCVDTNVQISDGTRWYTCSEIATDKPEWCAPDFVISGQAGLIASYYCCASCSSVGPLPTCVDAGVTFTFSGVPYSCSELAAQLPQKCATTITYNGVPTLISDICCESCSSVTIPTCYDESVSFTFDGVAYSCSELAAQIPERCATTATYNGVSQLISDICCESCSSAVIPTCSDTYGFILTITSENLQFTCAEIAAQRPYYCDDIITTSTGQSINIGEECCDSCSGVDIPTCYDRPGGWTFTYGTTQFTDCQSIADTIPWYCERDDTVVPEYCCETCSNTVIPSCYDLPANTGWYLNVSGVIYTDCADIYADHPSFCDNPGWVLTNCCATCRDSGTCGDDPHFVITIGTTDRTCAQLTNNRRKKKACCQGLTGTGGVLGTVGCCATCAAFIC
jgi:hypothetical protein